MERLQSEAQPIAAAHLGGGNSRLPFAQAPWPRIGHTVAGGGWQHPGIASTGNAPSKRARKSPVKDSRRKSLVVPSRGSTNPISRPSWEGAGRLPH